jgi:hypothetical protein
MPGKQNICGRTTSTRSCSICATASQIDSGGAAAIAAGVRSAGNRHRRSGVTYAITAVFSPAATSRQSAA